MPFDPFVAIIAMYSAILCASLAVLFWAFKGTFNPSGRFFVVSEAARIPALVALVVVHLDPLFGATYAVFIVSPFYLFSEVSFIYSLQALSKNHRPKRFTEIQCLNVFFCSALEAIRFTNPDLHLALYLIWLSSINGTAVWICTRTQDQNLRDAPFWKMLKYVETFFLTIGLIRLALLLLGTTITPTQGGSSNMILVAVMLTLLIFRSYCYQSIWMTWASPRATENRLNKNLMKTLHEREMLLHQLAASNRRLSVSALASSLAHQLSQPLTGAALQAEALRKRLRHQPVAPEAFQSLEKVTEILSHLSGVVSNLRSLFGNGEKFEKINLASLCKEVINLIEFSETRPQKNITIAGHIDSPIFGNPVQIQQVLFNLIENAEQAGRNNQSNQIEIILAEHENTVSVMVRDHGCGFDANSLENLFDLYHTTKVDGTGVGLWLCQQIIEKHKGSISAFNHADEGACVRIEFPVLGISS